MPVSFICHKVAIAKVLIKKLCAVTLIHTFLLDDNQVRGRSMRDGMIIFNIVGG